MPVLGQSAPIDADPLLVETIDRLLADKSPAEVAHAAERHGRADVGLWTALTDAGMTTIGSADGGVDGGILDAVAVLRACGERAVPVPIAEHGSLAGWLAQRAGLDLPGQMCTVPVADPADRIELTDRRITARFTRVPFAASASHLVTAVVVDGRELLVIAETAGARIDPSRNLAGEPRDFVSVDAAADVEVSPGTVAALGRRAVLGRVALMSGAMRRAVTLAAEYSHDRSQFGRPIAAFQAIQHLLALAAEHVVNVEVACSVAAEALASDENDPTHRVDVARVVSHEAMEVVTRNCHQVFGAIGTTREHELHLHTRRLWAWDLEWQTPEDSAAALTRWLRATAPESFWSALTAVTPIGPGAGPQAGRGPTGA